MTNNTLLVRLRNETRARHEQTEKLLYADTIRAGTLSRTEYEQLLLMHYLFHQALETAVAVQAVFFAGCDRIARQKTPWLVADLKRLGVPLPEPRPELFADWNAYQLLGAMYVAEGSTLGGQVIAKALAQTPGLSEVIASSQFFIGYGEQTGLRWKIFGVYLTNRADNYADDVVDAANRAFGTYSEITSSYER